jgi:VanZ family protein
MPTRLLRRLPPSGLGIGVVLGVCILLFGFGSTPASANLVTHPWDKLVHLCVFAVLTFGLRLTLPRIPVSMIIGMALSIALADELHQFFVPQRQPSWNDGIADSIGVLWGLTLWWQYKRTWPNRDRCEA